MGIQSMLRSLTRPASQWGPDIHLVRHTPLISLADMDRIAKACDVQLVRDVAPAHNIAPCRVLHTQPDAIPAGARTIRLIDDADEGSLGWHTEETGDVVTGVVGARTVLDNAGSVLRGPLSVSAVTSHEVVEMFANSHTSLWADTGQGWLAAYELADPVQGDAYEIGAVSVSNFVYDDWFSPISTPGDRFDHLGTLGAPFTIAEGGYVLRMQGGEVTPVFGEAFPDWLWTLKQRDAARTQRLTTGRPS